MYYIITLNNVKRSDLGSVGFRAVDLGVLREKRLNIPLTFVINNQAFEDFLSENGLKAKIEKTFQKEKPLKAYNEILELFNKAALPEELEAELFEAYESLAIDPGATASTIVSEWDYPFITLIRSPSYLLPTEDVEGIEQNIRGKDALVAALKYVWASIYSSKSVEYRKKAGVADSFGLGVIVQKMKKVKQSAVAYSHSELEKAKIIVKSFIGLQDYGFKEEILGKDYHEVDTDNLIIDKAEVNVQEYCIVRDVETGELEKQDLGEQGSRQKLDDKQIAEIARITKRAKSFIGKDLKLYLGVRDAYTYVFFANRLVAEPKKVIEEKEEIKLGVDEEGARVMEHKEEITTAKEEGEESFVMPEIISEEEARQEVAKEEQEEARRSEASSATETESPLEPEEEIEGFEAEEKAFEQALEKDLEFLEEIEREEIKGEVEEGIIEEEVEKEVNLLEEVLSIKEVIERMEEHALNNNKIAYEQEARKLKDMIERVRE